MKTLRNIVTLAVIGSVLIFAGCEEEETTQTISKEEAVQTLEQNSQEMASDFEQMANTEGMEAMEVLTALSEKQDPFAKKKLLGSESVLQSIEKTLKPSNNKMVKRLGDQPFDFEAHTGTYTWQAEGQWLVDAENPSDAIVIEFPTDTAADPIDNNAALTLSAYEETLVVDSDGYENYVPTRIEAMLEVDGTKVMEVTWELALEEMDDGSPMVSSLDATIYLKPFTYTLSLTQNSLSASVSHEDMESTLMSVNLDVTFMDDMEDIKKIEGNVQARNLNFKGWIKPYAMENVNPDDLESFDDLIDYYNEQIDLALYTYDKGNKIADVQFVASDNAEGDMPMELVFVFKDESTRPVKDYFENLITKLKEHLQRYNVS
ncbi:MAG: hypothetical protein KGY60_06900 [Bacteroidales bacterium]|nr:hypothetical protein [Bacteroidales bacterium]